MVRYLDSPITLLNIASPQPTAVLLLFDLAEQAFFKACLALTRVQMFGIAACRRVASMEDPESFRNGSHPKFVG